MGRTMGEKKAVAREGKGREKGKVLDEFYAVTGYNRCYGVRLDRER